MANSKTFLLLGLLFALLLISSQASARLLAESAQNQKTDEKEGVVSDHHGHYGHGHYGHYGHDHGHYGHDHGHHGHWGHDSDANTDSLDGHKHHDHHHGHH